MRFASCFLVVALGAVLALGVGCERSAPDAVAADETAQEPRVCAVSPAIAQMLIDMNLDGVLVGRHRFDAAAPQDVPIVGDQLELDYEMLLAVQPTEVLLQFGEQVVPPRLQQLAAEHNWNVESFDIDSADDIERVLRRLPEVLSFANDARGQRQREKARAAAEALASELHQALQTNDTVKQAGSLLLLWSVDPPSAFGAESFIGDVVACLGGDNILRSGAYPELTLEDIVALDPDTILLFAYDDADASLAARFGRLAELDLAAVRAGRLVVVQDPQVLIPTTSVPRVARKIEAALAGIGPVEEDEGGGP
jgi:ABC-type Fe3+-hydroxamate transport system substrate-binding protein